MLTIQVFKKIQNAIYWVKIVLFPISWQKHQSTVKFNDKQTQESRRHASCTNEQSAFVQMYIETQIKCTVFAALNYWG